MHDVLKERLEIAIALPELAVTLCMCSLSYRHVAGNFGRLAVIDHLV